MGGGILLKRSSKKGPYVDLKLRSRIEEMNKKVKESTENLVACQYDYTGHDRAYYCSSQWKKHIPVYITEQMVGHKREFAPTRTFKGHGILPSINGAQIRGRIT